MITEERLVNYIRSLEPDRSARLDRIRRESLAAEIPIIRDETAAFLRCIIRMRKPRRILELGTASGYSALTMAEVMPADAEILTVEKVPARHRLAEKNFREAGEEARITLLREDITGLLPELIRAGRQYDIIFLDAAKAQYPRWLPLLVKLLPEGGVLLADNVLQDGSIVESRFLIERRDRTIHERMRTFLFRIKHDPGLETAVLPLGDGLSISIRTGETLSNDQDAVQEADGK